MRKVTLLLLALGLAAATTAFASNPVRISQVYGSGGTYYKCDYVELFNNSTAPVDIGGWSVQYGSSSATIFGSSTYNYALIPSGATIPACGYYLIRGYSSSTSGIALPVTPDLAPSSPATWTFNLAATAGKVALFSDQVAGRTCATAQSSGMLVDLVGYGPANCWEGTATAPLLDATSVLVRGGDGAVDTDDNSADFGKVAQPWPMHNSAGAPNPLCGQGSAPPNPPTLVSPLDGAMDVGAPATLVVTVSDPDADDLTVQFYGRLVPPPPAPPVATAGTYVSSTGFQANWAASSGATSYRLDVSTSPGFDTYLAGYQDLAVSGTSKVVGMLVPETPYYYRVRAIGPGGTSGNSNTVTVTTTATPPPSTECELILLPDTQEYTTQENGGTIAMFQAQTQWIVDNHLSRNIVAVAHEGDITDKWSAVEYDRSLTAMTRLEDPATTGLLDGIPYAMLMGNHDDDAPALFNQYYGVSRFSGRGYYGGHYGAANDDSYILFSGAGRDFVLVSLSYAPSAAVLTWARGVLDAYPNRLGIVVSHSILNEGDTQTSWTAEGQAIYAALAGTPNLRLMACGHMSTFSGEGRRTDVSGGYTIHSLLADYQDRGDGGGGRLRILQFVPAENHVRVRTYSPYTNQWEADADSSSQFTLDVDLSVGAPEPQASPAAVAAVAAVGDFALLGTVAGVPSGSTASFSWAGLDVATPYEWFVRVGDGHTPLVTGPIWHFTTWDASTPTLLSRFTGLAVASGIELRWEFSEPGGVGEVTVERAGRAEGPWTAVAVEPHDENGVSVALDRGARSGGTYWYRLTATVGSARVSFGPITVTAGEVIREFALGWPQPNPTSGATRMEFAVPQASRVALGLYDMQGRHVATLAEGAFPAGRHQVVWNGMTGGRAAPTGIYFLRLRAEGVDLRRRVVVAR